MEQENIPIFSERGALDNTMKLIWKLTRWLNELFKIKKESFTAPMTILNSLAAHTHTWPMYFDYSSDTVISDDIKIDRCAEERVRGDKENVFSLSLYFVFQLFVVVVDIIIIFNKDVNVKHNELNVVLHADIFATTTRWYINNLNWWWEAAKIRLSIVKTRNSNAQIFMIKLFTYDNSHTLLMLGLMLEVRNWQF